MHDDQLTITEGMTRSLVASQFPEWAGCPIEQVAAAGTANAIFLIGDRMAARFPLRPDDPRATRDRLEREAAAAQELLEHTSFAVPQPIAIGDPGAGYPLPWSVQTWLPGDTAIDRDLSSSAAFAHDLAAFIAEVRAIDTHGRTFDGDGRGGDLPDHDDWMGTCFRNSDHLLPVASLRRVSERLRLLPRRSPDAMTHGDLIPGNVLVSADRLTGILDTGGLGPADPALDLVAAWHLLDAQRRSALRAMLHCDDVEWNAARRGRSSSRWASSGTTRPATQR